MYERAKGKFPRRPGGWPLAWGVACATAAAGVAAGIRDGAAAPGAAQPGAGVAAIVAGQAIRWEDLRPRLAEAAGAAVLEEIVLDRLVAGELRARSIAITDGDVAREADLLAEAMARTAGVASPDERASLVESIRRGRGLGDVRFSAMLRRNASLRALVRDEVTVSAEDADLAYQVRHGPKVTLRIIVVADQGRAIEVHRRVAPETGQGEPFGEVAAEVSTDASRYRGGLLEPLSAADPAYPAALRRAAADLAVGQVSQPFALDSGYAIIRVESRTPGDGADRAAVDADLHAEVRLVRERVAMDRLAMRLLADNRVTVFDAALQWSWEGRQRPAGP